MTFSVIDQSGAVLIENATTADAARTILTYDGASYEFRSDQRSGGWRLHLRRHAGDWRETGFRSPEPDRGAAEAEIFGSVVWASPLDHLGPEAIPDADSSRQDESFFP